jgi:YfiR/HmsC-like
MHFDRESKEKRMNMPGLPGGSISVKITCVVILMTLLMSGVIGGTSKSFADSLQEYQIKAAFLYNFAKFTEWPAAAFKDAQSAVTLCILGKDPFGDALDSLREKTIEGRRLVIKRVSKVEEAEKCHILFVSASEKESLSHILKVTKNWNVLTVGDTKGFAESGVMINLINIEDKVGFEINLDAAEHASLKISSKLLKLGKIIKEKN